MQGFNEAWVYIVYLSEVMEVEVIANIISAALQVKAWIDLVIEKWKIWLTRIVFWCLTRLRLRNMEQIELKCKHFITSKKLKPPAAIYK